MAYQAVLIPGDGIGPEVIAAATRVVAASGVVIEWHQELAGMSALKEHGDPLPPRVLDAIRRHKVSLKGPTETPIAGGHTSVNVRLRQLLELYANVRPVKSVLGNKRRYDLVDLVIVRENTEDLFCGIEHMVAPGVAVAMKVITEKASTRIARFAFEHARQKGRKRVTAGHKANIMKITDGLFLKCCREVARDYPEITYEEIVVDNLCTQLVLDPTRFDVLVLENLYGDLISDLCAGFAGGLGVAFGANVGADAAVFEAVHGTAPDIQGRDVANPSAMILTASLMLDHLGEADAAERIRRALTAAVMVDKVSTRDLGGSAGTEEFTSAVIGRLQS
jgi:isocitrate dehydrogenase (NAD+)